MSDNKPTGDKTLTVNPTKTLSLKRPEQGVVRQSFSHGRTKAVVVETVKRRILTPGEKPVAPVPAASPAPAPQPVARPAAPQPVAPAAPKPAGILLRTLSNDEQSARTQALAEARKREEEDRRRQEEEIRQRNAREDQERRERDAAEARKHEEEERRRIEDQVKRRAQEEAVRRLGEPEPRSMTAERRPDAAPAPRATGRIDRPAGAARPTAPEGTVRYGFQPREPAPRPATSTSSPARESSYRPSSPSQGASSGGSSTSAERGFTSPRPASDDADGGIRRPGLPPMRTAVVAKPVKGAERNRGRLTVQNATGSEEERTRSVASFRRRVQRLKGGHAEQKEKVFREVVLPETITIQELANRMSERGVDIIRLLMKQGAMHKITDVIDADTAQLIAEEMGHTVKRVAESDVEEGLFDAPDAESALESRPPVVTIMGHVDHGKTSLLDAIRHANVVSGEAGGITQHIGAYQVTTPLGGKVTFIDTPGHAAFTAMRSRGAKVTDIVVLVVAADDGVMPQTVEAINHAKAAKVPMIVAINKIDKPDAKPERVRSELLQYEVQVESLGGETIEVEVSATKKINLDKLLEMIQLQAELLDLKADPNRAAEGSVVEAKLDRGRGPVATVLVQRGTLRVGDIVVAGSEWGRVRALIDDQGKTITEAGPSVPVEVLGFNGAPEAGDRIAVVENEARAREISDYRLRQKRDQAAARGAGQTRTLADMMSQIKAAGKSEFPLVIKGDVQGSVEAILGSLDKLGTDEVAARVLHSGVGGISESDVTLANASGAVLIGFNVRAHKEAREAAERAGLEIRYYNIIYDLVDDVKKAMSGLLAPTLREAMLGNAEILEVFNITKVGKVAGCRVTDGHVERGQHVRLIRDNVVIHEGKLKTLKRFKDEVKEVQVGQECGMAFENYEDMRQGDVIECYRIETVQRTL